MRIVSSLWMLALLFSSGCNQPASDESRSVNRTTSQPPVAVKTVAVQSTSTERTTVQPATVLPYYRAEIRAKVSGYVRELSVDIGDFVEVGAPLAKLDVPELDAQVPVIEARISRALAEENRATSQVALAASSVQAAEALVDRASAEQGQVTASLAAANSELSRTQDLVQRGSLQAKLMDESRLRRDSQQARGTAVTSTIASAEAEVDVTRAQHAAAEADLQAAQADTLIARRQLDELRTQLDFATLTAPFTGVITERNIAPGDLVKNEHDATSLLVVSQIDKVRIHIPVPEIDAPLIAHGSTVKLSFPSFAAEEPLSATVTRFSGTLDPSTRSMLVEVEVDNAQRKLLPGMFGQATITLSNNLAVNSLPARAIRFDEQGKAYVYVVAPDETIAIVPIATGADNGHVIEVLSGVKDGDRVVDAHLQRFTTGQKVRLLGN